MPGIFHVKVYALIAVVVGMTAAEAIRILTERKHCLAAQCLSTKLADDVRTQNVNEILALEIALSALLPAQLNR